MIVPVLNSDEICAWAEAMDLMFSSLVMCVLPVTSQVLLHEGDRRRHVLPPKLALWEGTVQTSLQVQKCIYWNAEHKQLILGTKGEAQILKLL